MKPIPKRKLIPIITDLLEYREAGMHTISYGKKMQMKYGDVCEVSFTGIKNYFIHDPDVIKEILTSQGLKMKRTYFFRAFRKFLGNGLFTSDGDLHKQQRKLIKPAFYPQKIEEYGNIMVTCTQEEMAHWKDGAVINLNEAMTRITLNVITKSLFGAGVDDETLASVGKDVQSILQLVNRILQNPIYVYCLIHEVKIPIVRRFFHLKERMDQVIEQIISNYRQHVTVRKNDLLSMLMEAKYENSDESMTDEQIRDEVLTFFLAGHETTALALTWTFYLLGKHPEVDEKLFTELHNTISDGVPKATDYPSLSLSKNIFKEALRLYPPAWTFARTPTEDVTIQGYSFPKGCVLWTITYLMHHDERYFHDAEQFIPERWDEEGMKNNPKYAYFPFGGGNRMCIGEGFAWMEGILVMATIASKYKLSLAEHFTTDIYPVFTLRTKRDVMIKVNSRMTNEKRN